MNALDTRAGRLLFAGEARLLAPVRGDIERIALEGGSERGLRALAGQEAFFKQSSLCGKHALRHALRRALLLGKIPRLAEFANLSWLRAHGFLAPRPLLAGAFFRSGLPRSQFLFTEQVPGAPTLEELFRDGPRELRRKALRSLGHDLARMHALGFVHCDLFPRNLLVVPQGAELRIVFLDAWRGGPGVRLRGAAHDLGCLFLDGASLFDPEEQALLLTTYREERARAGNPLSPERLRRTAARARRRVFRRESRRRGEALASAWEPPAIG